MKNRIYKSNQILKIILSMVILLISLRYIGKIYQPTLLDDEFAYFGIAKYFTGTSWASAMSLCKYYSYGYSLLIAPFTLLIKDTVILYRVVVALNGLFLVAAFWLIDSIFRQLAVRQELFGVTGLQEKYGNGIALVSFLMTMLPCNMNYASVALSECLLLLLFALMVKILMCLNRDSNAMSYVALGGILMYSYMVHQRMLGVIIAAVIVLVFQILNKKIRGKQFISFMITIGFLYIPHTMIKTDIKENLWLNGSLSGENDMSGILGNIRQIFSSFSYFVKFIVSIFGKLFYMGSSTYLLGFVGLILCILLLFRQLKSLKFTGSSQRESKVTSSTDDGILFILLSFLMVLGISAVFMNVPENMAFLLYGRYLETFSPFLMGYGILALSAEKRDMKNYLFILVSAGVIYGIIGIVIRYFSKRWNLSWLNYISTGQLYRYLIGDSVPILRIMLVVFATAGMIFVVLRVRKFRITAGALLAVLLFAIFYQTAYIPMNEINLDLQKQRQETSEIAGVIRKLVSGNGQQRQVYYYVAENEPDDTAQYRDYVQYWLNDIYLNCILYNQNQVWNQLPEGSLILVSCENSQELELFQRAGIELVYENKICSAYCVTEQYGSEDDGRGIGTKQQSLIIDSEGTTLETRVNPPSGYTRIQAESDSLSAFLRNFPLKENGSPVLLYNGEKKKKQNVHAAVFALSLSNEDLQQCADSVIRIYAEYFWQIKQYDRITFQFVNGFQADYIKWREGYRIVVNGNDVSWTKTADYDDSYETFQKYMRLVFAYAGTLSMNAESEEISLSDIQVGDVFLKAGSPGHVVMIVDICVNSQGKKAFLLAQGYMPAQEFHLLKNPVHKDNNPWYYEEEVIYPFRTPEYTFQQGSLRRLKY